MRALGYKVPKELSMKRKRHGTDEIIRKLREAEAMEALLALIADYFGEGE